MTDKITIERETLLQDIGCLEAYEAHTGRKSAVLAHLRAALAAQPADAHVVDQLGIVERYAHLQTGAKGAALAMVGRKVA